MNKHLFLILLFLLSFKGISQKNELGKVTIDELKERNHPSDTSAVAAILFEKGQSYFSFKQNEGFSVITEVEVKIKIYKKAGYDWANKYISYYVGSNEKEVVEFSKAVTYNLVNGTSIEKSKLKSEGEFVEKSNKYWEKKKIVMPNVKEGSIIEYKYVIKSPFISTLPLWSFQSTIPVNYSEYITRIPEYFTYNVYKKGFVFPKETKIVNNKTITLVEKSLNQQGMTIKGYKHDSEQVNYQENQTTYLAERIPAIREEAFVNNISNYVSAVEHELASKKMPNSSMQFFSVTWDDVAKSIYESDGFGDQLKKTNYFEATVNKIVGGLNTNEEKTLALYEYVKSQVKWDGYTGISCDKGVKNAFEEKTGNVAEINLMLTAMLRYAGIDANPVLLSTRSNGMTFYPNRTAFNYVIAAVEIENGLILLDATDKFAMPNILPERALNWTGRIIRKNGSSAEVDLTPDMLSRKIVNIMANVAPDGIISGKVREQHYDYYAHDFRSKYASLNEESYLEWLEKKYAGIEIEMYKASNKSDLSKQVVEDYSFKHTGLSEKISDKIYINPMLFFMESENPFKQEKREYPVDFIFPNQNKYTISLALPEGYSVESVPAPLSLSMEEGLGNFHFNIVSNGNQIQLVATLSFNASVIPAGHYEMLKNFYKSVIEKNKEKIVLKKA